MTFDSALFILKHTVFPGSVILIHKHQLNLLLVWLPFHIGALIVNCEFNLFNSISQSFNVEWRTRLTDCQHTCCLYISGPNVFFFNYYYSDTNLKVRSISWYNLSVCGMICVSFCQLNALWRFRNVAKIVAHLVLVLRLIVFTQHCF